MSKQAETRQQMYPHPFKKQFISQSEQEQTIAGRFIPSDYVNATAMCKANGKRFSRYLKNKKTQEWIAYLSEVDGIPLQDLLITIDSGTWVHIQIALDLARWVSVEMWYWSNRVLCSVLEKEFNPDHASFQNARSEAQALWKSLRYSSGDLFDPLSRTIRAYLDSGRASENEVRFIYATCQNAINRGLFGKDAATIRAELGIKNAALNRDHFNEEALGRLYQIQTLAAKFAAKGQHPLDAIATALTMYDHEVMEYAANGR